MKDITIDIDENEENKETIKEPSAYEKKKAEKNGKIIIVVPIDPLNPKDKEVPVTINGKTTRIKRGEAVEITMNIYDILKESGYLGN